MSYKEDMQDTMRKIIDDIIEKFGGPDTSMTHLNLLFLSHMMESQSIFLKLYQEHLKTKPFQDHDDDHEEQIKGMTKAFMSSYLEFMKLYRKNRKKFIDIQSDIVKEHLECIDDMLDHINNEMRNNDAND